MDLNGNLEVLVDEGVSVTGDPVYRYKGYTLWVGIIHTKDANDLPHYLIFNDKYGVIEGSSNKLAEARPYLEALADANEKQEQALARGGTAHEEVKESGRSSKEWTN